MQHSLKAECVTKGGDFMTEYEKAVEELRKAYETDDWDYILCCQIELMMIQRKAGEGLCVSTN